MEMFCPILANDAAFLPPLERACNITTIHTNFKNSVWSWEGEEIPNSQNENYYCKGNGYAA